MEAALFKGRRCRRLQKDDESAESVLPVFSVGEKGPHKPRLAKKTTQPPKYYTEGTLLKAMETAGSDVDDEELRESLKANGIGRPSTRAAIIEILYKRGYIRRERKSLRATEAGIELINLIDEELLKSAKLTGMWERRLREIERSNYSAGEFISQLKRMISEITINVLKDNSNRKIGKPEEPSPKKRRNNDTCNRHKPRHTVFACGRICHRSYGMDDSAPFQEEKEIRMLRLCIVRCLPQV